MTNFGLFIRNLRIERGELLYGMASKLGVSSSYLSAVEHGKKELPKEWEYKIKSLYDLNEKELKELQVLFS